jgi:hypothetical protein
MRHLILTLALTGIVAAPAAAQPLTLEFHQGLVTVDAASVPVRAILNEWAKRGGTKIVGSERISGAPVTLKLVDVPEAKALEIILRSVAGYMAAPRSSGQGASVYDRILVMATSSTPPPPAAARPPSNPNALAGTQRFVPPRRQQDEDEDNEQQNEEEDPNPPNPPVFTFPGAPNSQPGQFAPQNGVQAQPVIVNPQTGQTITINPSTGSYPTPSPFGGAPGSISSPPPQPGQPGVATRPPGRQQ